MKKQTLKHGGFSLLVTVIFIAGIVLVNAVAGLLADRFFLKIDLTETNLYTMTSETKTLLSNMKEDVTFYVLSDEAEVEGAALKVIREMLNNYVTTSGGRIKVEYVSPNLNPWLSEKYNLVNFEYGDLIIESARRYTAVSQIDLFEWEADDVAQQYNIVGINAEQALASSIVFVTADRISKAVFLEGHQESAVTALENLFAGNGYAVEKVNLASANIPENTAVLVCAAPQSDLLQSELDKIDAYMNGGGNMIVFNGAEPLHLKNLDLFLAEWGFAAADRMVFDAERNFGDPGFVLTHVNQPDAEMLPGLASAGMKETEYVLNMFGRPIDMLWPGGSETYRHAIPLLSSFSSSYAKALDPSQTGMTPERGEGDVDGPLVMAALSQLAIFDNTTGVSGISTLVFANIAAVDDEIIDENSPYTSLLGNRKFFSLLINDLNPVETESVYIPPKAISGGEMLVTGSQRSAVLVMIVILPPVLIILIGILVWRRRKNL